MYLRVSRVSHGCCRCICGKIKVQKFCAINFARICTKLCKYLYKELCIDLCSWMYKDLFSARRGKEQEGRAVSVINSAHRDFLMYLLWPSIYQTIINYSQTTPFFLLHWHSYFYNQSCVKKLSPKYKRFTYLALHCIGACKKLCKLWITDYCFNLPFSLFQV